MPHFTKNDLDIIRSCFEEKHWRGKKIVNEFPSKQWTVSSVNRAIRRIELGGANPDKKKKPGSGRPRTARTQENLVLAKELSKSPQNEFGTSLSQRAIARQLKISRRSVQRMLKKVQTPSDTGKKFRKVSTAKIVPDGGVEIREKSAEPNSETSKKPPEGDVGMKTDGSLHAILRTLLEEFGPDAVFIAIETSLYFRAVPEELVSFLAVKKQTERVSVLMTCNLAGLAKRRLLVVGVSKNPRCFQTAYDLPVDYAGEKTARITEEIVMPHLLQWDEELGFRHQNVALLVNGCLVDPAAKLRNIKVVPFPQCGSGPLDHGLSLIHI